ncbi:MAG: hypothetical protein K1X29_08570 [Bdellovibrionales bacterium]|nr:hypothetical protein [Bdellovibrionales bacterium]
MKNRVQIWLSELNMAPTQVKGEPVWQEIQLEFLAIDHQPHQAIQRLQSWRSRLKLTADFRRRSGQVLAQVRLQATLVGVLYVALLLFSLMRGVWRTHAILVGVSMILFLMGVFLIFKMGKKIKWSF